MTEPRDRNGVLLQCGDIVCVECRVIDVRDTKGGENDTALVTIVPCALEPHGSRFALHASQVTKSKSRATG